MGRVSLCPSSSLQSQGQGSQSLDEAGRIPKPHQALGAGCCPAKPSAPDSACPAAALPSLPTPCGAGTTGLVGLAGTSSCQAPAPGSKIQAGLAPLGWLRAARLRHHTPTMGTLGGTHSAGTWWPCTVGLARSPSAAASLHQRAAPGGHWISPTKLGRAHGLIPR